MSASRCLLFVGVLVATSGAMVAKLPHLRLALALAGGDIDGRVVPMTDFATGSFTGKTVNLRCGDLHFDVPQDASVEPSGDSDVFSRRLQFGGVACRLYAPQRECGLEEDCLGRMGWARTDGRDALDGRVALGRTSGQDFSFWMSGCEAEALHARLAARPMFFLGSDHAEVLRGETLSGLLLFLGDGEQQYMEFDYFSRDAGTRGRVFLSVDLTDPVAMNQARAFLASLRIAQEATS
jgi:hypothetical protein